MPGTWLTAGPIRAVQFTRPDHRDHRQRGPVLQAQVDAGMIASELAEIGSERHQMLSRQRDAEAQRADDHVTRVVHGLFRLRGAGQGPAGRADQGLAAAVSRTGLVPRMYRGVPSSRSRAWSEFDRPDCTISSRLAARVMLRSSTRARK